MRQLQELAAGLLVCRHLLLLLRPVHSSHPLWFPAAGFSNGLLAYIRRLSVVRCQLSEQEGCEGQLASMRAQDAPLNPVLAAWGRRWNQLSTRATRAVSAPLTEALPSSLPSLTVTTLPRPSLRLPRSVPRIAPAPRLLSPRWMRRSPMPGGPTCIEANFNPCVPYSDYGK